MDLKLKQPGLSGLEGIRKLRKEWPALPVVALSAFADRDDIEAVRHEGAMGFIPKDYSIKQFLWVLEWILVHKGFYWPETASARHAETTPAKPSDTIKTPKDLQLTPAQTDVAYLWLQGMNADDITKILPIEAPTVKAHIHVIMRAMNVASHAKAVYEAARTHLVFGDETRARIALRERGELLTKPKASPPPKT
jgi:DNA-binding NarL/FixJ family response regulator